MGFTTTEGRRTRVRGSTRDKGLDETTRGVRRETSGRDSETPSGHGCVDGCEGCQVRETEDDTDPDQGCHVVEEVSGRFSRCPVVRSHDVVTLGRNRPPRTSLAEGGL